MLLVQLLDMNSGTMANRTIPEMKIMHTLRLQGSVCPARGTTFPIRELPVALINRKGIWSNTVVCPVIHPPPNIAASTTITVDPTPPTASAPAPLTVYCPADVPAADITVVTDEADNCDTNPIVTFVGDVSDGGTNPEIITRTYRITDASGNTLDVEQTITVSPFSISTQPTDQTLIVGNSGFFSVTANGTDTYQWEVSTDGGSNFVALVDGPDYSGTQTANLSVISPQLDKTGYLFRVLVSNSTASCSALTSSEATLTMKVGTVITNRKVTYRVNKN